MLIPFKKTELFSINKASNSLSLFWHLYDEAIRMLLAPQTTRVFPLSLRTFSGIRSILCRRPPPPFPFIISSPPPLFMSKNNEGLRITLRSCCPRHKTFRIHKTFFKHAVIYQKPLLQYSCLLSCNPPSSSPQVTTTAQSSPLSPPPLAAAPQRAIKPPPLSLYRLHHPFLQFALSPPPSFLPVPGVSLTFPHPTK